MLRSLTPVATAAPPSHHSVLVRITHWLTALSFFALLVSGVAILLVHPRLYWGETGGVGTPSLIDLPLPFVFEDQSGWGRSLHFLSAWIVVLTGLVYLLFGWRGERPTYGAPQRLTYMAVVFVLFPVMIWTGLAMSPAVTSVIPILVTAAGGQQSARTIHFVVTNLLILFLIVHVTMVALAGFVVRLRSMTYE